MLSPALMAVARPGSAAGRGAWSLALPPVATVRLKQGGSLSGRLVKLSTSSVTLAVGSGGRTRSVALAKIESIDYVQPNDLWVTRSNGLRQQFRPVRGLSLPIEALPISSFHVDGAGDMAIVDLTTVFTDDQFARLSQNPEVMYVLNQLSVGPDGKILLRVWPYGMQ